MNLTALTKLKNAASAFSVAALCGWINDGFPVWLEIFREPNAQTLKDLLSSQQSSDLLGVLFVSLAKGHSSPPSVWGMFCNKFMDGFIFDSPPYVRYPFIKCMNSVAPTEEGAQPAVHCANAECSGQPFCVASCTVCPDKKRAVIENESLKIGTSLSISFEQRKMEVADKNLPDCVAVEKPHEFDRGTGDFVAFKVNLREDS